MSTDKPEYGSVEYYADLIRQHAKTTSEVRIVALSGIDTAVLSSGGDPAVAVDRVRNALAAAELALAELRGAAR